VQPIRQCVYPVAPSPHDHAILFDVLAPILILMGAGALLRWRFHMTWQPSSKINIYLLARRFVFDKVSTSTLSWEEMGGVVTISLVQVVTLGLLVWGVGWVLRVRRQTLAAVAMAVMFYNSGNYGLPLAELAYPQKGVGVSEYRGVGVTDSTPTPPHPIPDTSCEGRRRRAGVRADDAERPRLHAGLAIAGFAHHVGRRASAAEPLADPPAARAADALRGARGAVVVADRSDAHLPLAITETGVVPVGGARADRAGDAGGATGSNPRWPRWKPVSLVLVLRLLLGPVQMAALLYGFHLLGWNAVELWPWPAELLILTAAVPTAGDNVTADARARGDTDLAAIACFGRRAVRA
jgi:uncharacterized membrane protein